MLFYRKMILLFLGFLHRFSEPLDPGNPAETGYLGKALGNSWWYQDAGPLQVHIRSDPDLAWEVFVWDPLAKRHVSRPSFRPNLTQAFELAVHLHKHYMSKSAQSHQDQALEMAHG